MSQVELPCTRILLFRWIPKLLVVLKFPGVVLFKSLKTEYILLIWETYVFTARAKQRLQQCLGSGLSSVKVESREYPHTLTELPSNKPEDLWKYKGSFTGRDFIEQTVKQMLNTDL